MIQDHFPWLLPDFSKIIFFPDISLTTQIPTFFSSFSWPVGTLLESYRLGIGCGEKSNRAWTWAQWVDGHCQRSSRGQGHRRHQRSLVTRWCERIPGWLVPAMVVPTQPTVNSHNNLHTSDANLLSVPRVHTCFGSRNFLVAAPIIWNSHPTNVRNSCSIAPFCRQIKTPFFNLLTSLVPPPHPRCPRIGEFIVDIIVHCINLLTYLFTTAATLRQQ